MTTDQTTRAEEGASLAQYEAEDRRVCAALKVWHEIHDTANVDDDPADLEHAAMSFALAEADKLSAAESRAASAEAEVERLARERDDARVDEELSFREKEQAITAVSRRLLAAEDRVAVLESALRSLEESLRPAEHVPFVDPVHGAAVEALGHRIGFGALMSSASASWAAFLEAIGTPGGEFVSGPCRSVLQADLRAARAALNGAPNV